MFQLKAKSEDLDGVTAFTPKAKPIAHIRLPERRANLTFGRPKNNRLYMTACRSIYAFYVELHARFEKISHFPGSGALISSPPRMSTNRDERK